MIELELTYLAKYLPDGLQDCKSKEIIDVYIPKSSDHPKLRIRKNGDKMEITKKEPVNEGDISIQLEQTIKLKEDEFNELLKIDGKEIHKIRYYYNYHGIIAEFDVFQGDLQGLVVIDFEFENEQDKNNFKIPEFCLIDITQESFIAGGMICGKKYSDIENILNQYKYQKLYLNK